MISRDWHIRDHRIEPPTSSEPFSPFAIGLRRIDQIACVKKELGLWRIAVSFADDTGPHRSQIVLSISKVDKGKRLLEYVCGSELKPFAPVGAVPDPVGVFRSRCELFERDAMEVSRIQIGFESHRFSDLLLCFLRELGSWCCFCDLSFSCGDLGAGPPCDRLGVGRVARPCQDDAIGKERWCVNLSWL